MPPTPTLPDFFTRASSHFLTARQATQTIVVDNNDNNNGGGGGGLDAGAIVGIVLGTIAGILLIWWIVRTCSQTPRDRDRDVVVGPRVPMDEYYEEPVVRRSRSRSASRHSGHRHHHHHHHGHRHGSRHHSSSSRRRSGSRGGSGGVVYEEKVYAGVPVVQQPGAVYYQDGTEVRRSRSRGRGGTYYAEGY